MKKSIIHGIVGFAERHAIFIIILTILVSIFFGYKATKISIDPNVRDIFPENAKIIKLSKKYGEEIYNSEYLLLAVESNDPFRLDKLQKFYQVITRIEAIDNVGKSLNPFNLISFQKKGVQLQFVSTAKGKRAPKTKEELEIFKKRLLGNPLARNLVVSADHTSMIAIFPVSLPIDHNRFLARVESITGELKGLYEVHIGGQFPFDRATERYLKEDVPKFLIIALLVILFVYYSGFRTPRAVILPLLVVSLGTIWSVGTMKLLGFNLTVVSIMTPPLVLTLGSSYSIHVLNQYYREANTDSPDKSWIANAVTHINKTILMAALTTIIGFASLLSATLRQIREFGIATSFGIAYCAILSLFFFPAILSLLPSPKQEQQQRVLKGALTTFLERIGNGIPKYRYIITGIVIVILVGFFFSMKNIKYQTDFTKYYRKKEVAVDDNLFIVRKFGGFVEIHLTMTAPNNEKNYFLKPNVLKKISLFEDRLLQKPDIAYVSSFVTYLKMINETITGKFEIPERRSMVLLISRYFKALSATDTGSVLTQNTVNKDFSRLTITFRVYDSDKENYILEHRLSKLIKQVKDDMESFLPSEANPELWGKTLATLYLSETLSHDQLNSVLVSAILIFIVTALAFSSVWLGLIALVPMLTGIMLNFILMSILNLPLDVVTVMFSSVAIGVGVDNSIHLLIQYRRQKRYYSKNIEKVISHTLKISGRPILLSTVSLVIGLLALTFSNFMPIVYFGLLVAMVLFTTAVGAIIVLPAILSLLG